MLPTPVSQVVDVACNTVNIILHLHLHSWVAQFIAQGIEARTGKCFICWFLYVLCPQFIGAIYTYSAGGEPLPAPRRGFLDAAEPANLVMRVSQSAEDEDKVLSYYSWSRSKPHHYILYIFVLYMALAPGFAEIHMYVCNSLFTTTSIIPPFSKFCVPEQWIIGKNYRLSALHTS